MYTCVFLVCCVLLLVQCARAIGSLQIVSKKQIPLTPVSIECSLTDIITISSPILPGKTAKYRLYNPKGEGRSLKILPPKYSDRGYDLIRIKYLNNTKVITPMNSFKIFNVNFGQNWGNTEDAFAEKEREMDNNDFMIGPLGEEDYGNWVLSIFYKDHADWTEVYQVITVNIVEMVPAEPKRPIIKVGDTLKLSFAYPIKGLHTCELVVPKTSFDKFFDREPLNMDACGYVVRNMSLGEAGFWWIIGVGRITYQARVNVTVTAT